MDLQNHLISAAEPKVADGVYGGREIVFHDIGDGGAVVGVVALGEVFKSGLGDSRGVPIAMGRSEGVGSNLDGGIAVVEMSLDVEVGVVLAFQIL